MSIETLQLRQILEKHVPKHAERIMFDVALLFKPALDPPPREMTLEEEIARMCGEGCPNGD